MEQEKEIFEQNIKLLQDELEKYKDSKTSYKSYMQFMDDISVWLQKMSAK